MNAHRHVHSPNCPEVSNRSINKGDNVDDSYGWGYELSQKGQVIDRFHTQPTLSPTLREKKDYDLFEGDKADDVIKSAKKSIDISTLARLSLPTLEQMAKVKKRFLEQEETDFLTPDQKRELEKKLDRILANLTLPTSEQKDELAQKFLLFDSSILEELFPLTSNRETGLEKYSGTPSTIANIFGVIEDLVVYYLSETESNFETELHDKMIGFFELLGIENGDGTYQDLLEESDDRWDHLIFVRQTKAIELQWREKWKGKLPFVAPPLWLKKK